MNINAGKVFQNRSKRSAGTGTMMQRVSQSLSPQIYSGLLLMVMFFLSNRRALECLYVDSLDYVFEYGNVFADYMMWAGKSAGWGIVAVNGHSGCLDTLLYLGLVGLALLCFVLVRAFESFHWFLPPSRKPLEIPMEE